jgi:hypothetical protein
MHALNFVAPTHAACAKTLLAHAQNTLKICLRMLSMRFEELFKSDKRYSNKTNVLNLANRLKRKHKKFKFLT